MGSLFIKFVGVFAIASIAGAVGSTGVEYQRSQWNAFESSRHSAVAQQPATIVAPLPTSEEIQSEPAPDKDVVVAVQAGESLSVIAGRYGLTYKRLFDANPGIKSPDLLAVGQSIRIPRNDEQLAERPLPAAEPIVAAQPIAQTQVASPAPAVADGSVWDRLAACESGGRWNINTGNGYFGGLQFLPSTWRAVGGSGLPHENSREEQILRGQILQARSGWGQWPACARKLGLL